MTMMQPTGSFIWGPSGQQLTPEARAQMNNDTMAPSPDFSPVGSWTQGMSRLANAMAGAYRRQADAFPAAPGGGTPSFGTQIANVLTMRNNGGLY